MSDLPKGRAAFPLSWMIIKPTSILIADDHAVVRVGLTSMLSIEDDLKVVAEAADGAQAVELFRRHRPDVVLLDVRMAGCGGIEALRMIRAENPEARVLMLSSSELEEEVAQSIEAGAAGFILKTEGQDVLVAAIRAVARGERHFSPGVLRRLEERQKLSSRELQVLEGMSAGLGNKEIAARLRISEHTVKTYVKTILDKLQASDRTGAVSQGYARGLLKVS